MSDLIRQFFALFRTHPLRIPAQVFISYASADWAWAERLVGALEESGFDVVWDREILAASAGDLDTILALARSVVAVWSHRSARSEAVLAEADAALAQHKLLPVLIERGVEPPEPFGALPTEDLSDWDGTAPSEAFDRLAERIKRQLGDGTKSW